MDTLLAAILPSILGLLQTPAFQTILKAILDDLVQKLASGASPTAAVQQTTGLVTAAAALHLGGNPVTNIQTFLASLPIPIVLPSAPAPLPAPLPQMKPAGTFTS
jgi:hypothetical protein